MPAPDLVQIMPADNWWVVYLARADTPEKSLSVSPLIAFAIFQENDGVGDGCRMLDGADDYGAPISNTSNLAGYYRSVEPPRFGEMDWSRFINADKVKIPDEWFLPSSRGVTLDGLDLNYRVREIISKLGVKTVDELTRLTEGKIRCVSGAGRGAVVNIRRALKKHGLDLHFE